MRVNGYINGFSAGELAQDVWERADLQQHAKGMAPGRNMLVQVTGPAVSRGGFWDRGAAKHQDQAGRLVAFVRSVEDALLLEFYDLGFRVWTPEGNPVMSGGTQVAVVTTWTAAQLAGLWFKQSGDVLRVTSQAGLKPRVIKRLANDDWQIADDEFRDGPWLPENVDPAFTLACDAIEGTVAVTASQSLFTADHVGACFRLRAQSSGAGMGGWTAQYDVLIDYEMLISDGKIYRTTTPADGNKTGSNPPVHESGIANDGGMNWEYLHDGSGILRITAVTDDMHATAEVVTRMLPTQGTEQTHSGADGFRRVLSPSDETSIDFPATSYWAEQAFSAARGWPRALVEEREERLVFADTAYRPALLHATRTAAWTPDYAEFKPNLGTGRLRPDDSVRMSVGKAGAAIHWACASTFLVIGTADAEFLVTGGNIDDPLKPDSYKAIEVSRYGAAPIAPVVAHGPPQALLFVTRTGKALRILKVSADATIDGQDGAVLAAHVADRGFAELAWQSPENVCWARLADGGLAAFTFHEQQQVAAWTSQQLPGGFTLESLATVPSATLGGDVLWALVTRSKDGAPQRRLWRLARRSEGMFLDAAGEYSGAPATSLGGLDHLEGETVAIVSAVDGQWARQPDAVVTGGAVALRTAASDAIAGLPLARRFESLPLDLQGVGTTIGRALQLKHAIVTFYGVEVSVGDGTPQGTQQIRRRPPDDLSAPPPERIKQRVGLGSGADRDRRVVAETDAPFDLVIYSIGLEAEVQP